MSPSEPLYVLKILSEDGSLVRRFPLPLGAHVIGSAADVEVRLETPGVSRRYALGALVRHSWPGNVRELQNEIAKAALLLEPGEPLDLQHLSDRVRRPVSAPGARPPLLTLEEAVRQAEREAFSVALAAAEGDAGCAMELLGVSRTTWYRKMKELGLTEAEEAGSELGTRTAAPAAERHVM